MRDAVLLIGPTGSGKSPLGDTLAQQGLVRRKTVHFDFGENLRRAERGEFSPDVISEQDRLFLRRVLQEGAVLEYDKFYLAGNILSSFLANHHDKEESAVVILNGFPCHTLQAEYIAQFVRVRFLVVLQVPNAETVWHRLQYNTGGDRANRTDDADLQLLATKLQIFQERTLPLANWYKAHSVTIIHLKSDKETTAAAMWNELNDAVVKLGGL